jgi:predicted DNA-binding antitoxin AbrB/MazE fold protein
MQQIVEAIYEQGVFRPLKTLELSEGQAVQLIIHANLEVSPDEMLKLAAEVYAGLSDDDIDEVENIALDRTNFFEEKIES